MPSFCTNGGRQRKRAIHYIIARLSAEWRSAMLRAIPLGSLGGEELAKTDLAFASSVSRVREEASVASWQ